MRKFLFPILFSLLIFGLISCGGGGGGGGGATVSDNEYTTHNPGGWGGGDSSGGSTSGSDGSGSGNSGSSSGSNTTVTISGGTPLSVSTYSFNGTQFTSVEELVKAIKASGVTGTFNVPFVVNGETRQARVTMNGTQCTIEHQYKATYTLPGNSTPQEVFYYKNDGIQLGLPPVTDSLYAEESGICYHTTAYTVNGNSYSATSPISVAPNSGDLNLGTIGIVKDTSYGFRTADNTLVVNQQSGTIVINNAGGKTFETVELSSSAANGSISLDFSGVTGFSLIGYDGGGPNLGQPAITNGAKLGSVTLPDTDFSLGFGAFKDCPNLTSLDLSHCTSLGIWALQNCTGLSTVDLSHCTTIGEYALEGCTSLTGNIDLSGYTDSTIKGVFKDCEGITGVTLPAAITQIDESTFLNCSSLSSIDLSNCTQIGQAAFFDCTSLSDIGDLSSCEVIAAWALRNTNLSGSINLSNCISIGASAFQMVSGLTGSLDLSKCESIGSFAFHGCSGLADVTFGSLVNPHSITIGDNAFTSAANSYVFNLSNNPNYSVSYESAEVFDNNVSATWFDGMQTYPYHWVTSSGEWE